MPMWMYFCSFISKQLWTWQSISAYPNKAWRLGKDTKRKKSLGTGKKIKTLPSGWIESKIEKFFSNRRFSQEKKRKMCLNKKGKKSENILKAKKVTKDSGRYMYNHSTFSLLVH